MEIALSDDQILFRDTTRRALDDRCPIARVRELVDDPVGFDRATWRQGGELGWYAMLVPEAYGGGSVSGDGLVDLTIVAEELGRVVHPGPCVATNVVAFALAEFGTDEQRKRHLAALATGELIGTWAHADQPGAPVTAVASGTGFVLRGAKTLVHDGAAADLLLVSAASPHGPIECLVDRSAPGVAVESLESLDLARRFATIGFDDVTVAADAVIAEPSAIERQLQVALVLQCAETNGAVDQGLAITVQYSKDRVAFGRPIGSYQALKHRMADHRMWLEGSFATTAYAARAVSTRARDAAIAARVAKAHVGKWSTAILHDCIQLHGGIGMTWDYDLHLYFRRAISNEVLHGTPTEHCQALVDLSEGAA